MAFDSDAAMQRIKGELETLAEELWPGLPKDRRLPATTTEEKMEIVHGAQGFMRNPSFKHLKFSIVYYILDNRYWQAGESWKEIQSKPDIKMCWTEEDAKFYALLIIEKAKTDREVAPGHQWIVKAYDDGPFRPYIDRKLLTWAVNKSFWESAEAHFSKTPKTNAAITTESYYFDLLSNYLDLVDLTDTSEFKPGPLIHRHGWPDKSYVDAFNRARQTHKLDNTHEAFLARPIIEHYIDRAFQELYDPMPNREQFLKEKLKPYEMYLSAQTVRELLEEKMKIVLKNMAEADDGNDFELGPARVNKLKLLAQFRFTPEQALEKYISKEPFDETLRNFVSENMPVKEGLATVLVNSSIPAGLFNDRIRAVLEAELTSRADVLLKNSLRNPTEYLQFIGESLALGFVSQEKAESLAQLGFTAYLSMKPRPSARVAISVREAIAKIPTHEEPSRGLKEKVDAQIKEDLRLRSPSKTFMAAHRVSKDRTLN